MVEFELYGLNERQRILADIMWDLEEWDQVQNFIDSLPKRERAECEGIIEMMRMAVVEQCYTGIRDEFPEADQLIKKVSK